jgi:pyruvate,orthophosphate dikinase
MARSAGILTTRGGLASHAAVVARGWDIPAVVGAATVEVTGDGVRIDGRRLAIGHIVTIDGGTGEVFEGEVGGSRTVAPEAAVLLGWARELGIAIGPGEGGAGKAPGEGPGEARAPEAGPDEEPRQVPAEAPGGAPKAVAATPDDVLRALLVKGMTPLATLATAIGADQTAVASAVSALTAAGSAEPTGDAYRLTAEGKLRALSVVAADGERLGAGGAAAALEGFGGLDERMKQIVTAWQVRPGAGEPVINDHSDAVYDDEVLERLAGLHADAAAWLAELAARLPRLDRYRARLEAALTLARGGDARYVASPRVDSYHGVWFELHEDLIRLAGRTRADEAAAGRA